MRLGRNKQVGLVGLSNINFLRQDLPLDKIVNVKRQCSRKVTQLICAFFDKKSFS